MFVYVFVTSNLMKFITKVWDQADLFESCDLQRRFYILDEATITVFYGHFRIIKEIYKL